MSRKLIFLCPIFLLFTNVMPYKQETQIIVSKPLENEIVNKVSKEQDSLVKVADTLKNEMKTIIKREHRIKKLEEENKRLELEYEQLKKGKEIYNQLREYERKRIE